MLLMGVGGGGFVHLCGRGGSGGLHSQLGHFHLKQSSRLGIIKKMVSLGREKSGSVEDVNLLRSKFVQE